MSKPSEDFKASFDSKYPTAFLEKYHVIECLSVTAQGETLLVGENGTEHYYIAKVTTGGDESAEAELLRSLSHPALPKVYDSFVDGETHILVRAFIKGTPLDQAIQERPFSESEAVGIGIQLCDVLTYLHTQTPPVIHRDVKPGNVILGADGKVWLIDFGIARTYKQDARKDTVFSGTNDFAPPEQYGFSQTDARADIFSLGMLLKYLLTRGDLDGQIENRRLRRIISRCTAFAPRQRYANAEAVKRALLHASSKTARLAMTAAIAVAAILCGVLVGRYLLPYVPSATPAASVVFVEPIIERAVRLMLDKPEGDLTQEELLGITALYIVYDDAQTSQEDWFTAFDKWHIPGVSNEGGIETLADISYLPNLDTLFLASGTYKDLSPITVCSGLKRLTVYNNYSISDLEPLGKLELLESVNLVNCDGVTDISPLADLPKLTELDLTGYQTVYDPQPVERMGNFDTLLLHGNATAYRYVHDKRVGWLRLSETAIETVEPLHSVRGITYLELQNSYLRDLSGIGVHVSLRKLDISHTAVTDLTPLTELINLKELILSEDMDADVSVLADMPNLTITYQ